jgi:hypothetical protein
VPGVEGVDIEFAANVGDGVCAQDVEGEAAEAGEGGWLIPDAAAILVEGYVADIVASIFYPPMEADRGAEDGGGQDGERGIERNLVGLVPEP